MIRPTSDEVKLLPCACGETAFVAMVNDARQVWCRRDMCWKGPLRSTKAEAIAAWNNSTIPTRPPVVTDEVVERVAEVETGLRVAMVASCNCEHEANISPKPEAHDLTCRYRVLYVAADLLADIRLASMPAVVSGGQT